MSAIRTQRSADTCTVILDGALTAACFDDLRAALFRELEAGARAVSLDLGRADRLDGSGLAFLLRAANTLEKRNGRFDVVNVPAPLLELLHSLGLTTRLNARGA
ncbi:MAG: STAS domain-containing protein [Myxococcales bacterium]